MSNGRTTSTGLGIVLFTAGAILTWALEVDIPFINEGALGVVLMMVGILAVVVSIVMELQSTRSRHVVEHRNADQYGNSTYGNSTYERR